MGRRALIVLAFSAALWGLLIIATESGALGMMKYPCVSARPALFLLLVMMTAGAGFGWAVNRCLATGTNEPILLGAVIGAALLLADGFGKLRHVSWAEGDELRYYYLAVHYVLAVMFCLFVGLTLVKIHGDLRIKRASVWWYAMPLVLLSAWPFNPCIAYALLCGAALMLWNRWQGAAHEAITSQLRAIARWCSRLYRSDRGVMIAIAMTALLLRAAFGVKIAVSAGYVGFDGELYDQTARHLGGLMDYLQSGFVSFLAVVYALTGQSYVAVAAVQSALAAMTCVLIFLIGRDVFNRTVGVIAATISVVYGQLVFYSYFYGVENLLTFFMTLSIYLSLRVSRGAGPSTALLAGVSSVLAILIKVVAAPIVLILLVYQTISARSLKVPAVAWMTVIVLMSCILYAQTAHPLSLGECDSLEGYVAIVFFMGNHPFFTGHEDSIWLNASQYNELQKLGFTVDESLNHEEIERHNAEKPDERKQIDEICYTSNTWNVIRYNWEHAGPYVRLLGAKLYNMFLGQFSYHPEFDTFYMINGSWFSMILRICMYGLFGLATVVCLVYKQTSCRGLPVLLLCILAYVGVHLVFMGVPRYRVPIVPIMLVVEAFGALWVVRRLVWRRWDY